MRILHLDPDDIENPLSGGGPVRTYEICRRLARRHEIVVATPTFPGSTPDKIRDGIRYIRLGRRIGNHGSSHHVTFLMSLPGIIRRTHFDLLIEDLMPPASTALTPLFTRRPVIASVQWFFAREWAERYHLPFHWGEKYGVRLYRNFVVLSRSMRERIEAAVPGARCVTIPNGVDDSLFEIPRAVGDGILYLGRVDTAQKGLDLLMRSYARLEPPRPRLTIAGHGYEHEAVRKLAAELRIEADVDWFGRYDSMQREKLLAACRFVCVPSRDETFGMVIAEACAAGKPVVVFDRAPMNEIVLSKGPFLVAAFDIDAYAAAMRRLAAASDGEILRRGEACRAGVVHLNWDSIARQQEDFYLDAVAQSRQRAKAG